MNTATELRAAAAKLRKPLPGDLIGPPRLVMTDSETVSGIAFCVEHLLPRDFEHEYSACDNCEVIDCLYGALAELVHALLTSRQPAAAWLDAVADKETALRGPVNDVVAALNLHPFGFESALAVARAITGRPR